MKKDCTVSLVVGLGNYGNEFNGTRHNIGFEVLDKLNSNNKKWNPGEHGLWCLDNFNNAILIKPIVGMNASGIAIKDGHEAISPHHSYNTIIIHDDMDFEPGIVRIKFGGSDGKHNGVKSIIKHIGNRFVRIRVGIGKPISKEKGIDFVLEKFNSKERKIMDNAIELAAEAVVWVIQDGIEKAMCKFNRRS